jgi:predicted naringenin-chalcone synthase
MANGRYCIGAVDTAVPEFALTQEQALGQVKELFATELSSRSKDLLARLFGHKSIATRHFALDPGVGIAALKNEDPDARMARFTAWSIDLSAQAAKKVLDKCGLSAADIDVLVVNTCTGYVCPGLSTYLLERLGLRRDAILYDLSGSGCGGAVPNLQVAASLLTPGGTALCIAVEICTAAFQMGNDPSLLVSNAIFGDGAAAAIVWDRPNGCAIEGFASLYDPQMREHVRFVHKNGALHNQISGKLPEIVGSMVPDFLRRFIGSFGMGTNDIEGWALHSGGDRMITAIGEKLGLAKGLLVPVKGVLRDFGNLSSPSVLFCLGRILDQGLAQGSKIVMCAYGAGMSAHACMLTVSPEVKAAA